MSHVAVRIVAAWLQDQTYGVNAVAAALPLDTGDTAPPTATVYDETHDGWVARWQLPKALGSTLALPAVLVMLHSGKSDGGVPESQDTGARTVDGSVQIAIHLIQSATVTATAAAAGMYLLRAISNSLLQLNDPSRDTNRTRLGVRLYPSYSVMQAKIDAPIDDTLVASGSLLVTYETIETTALTLS